jgi:glutamate formiminotransferase / 5-formyltetrahydrofolate cyclo-ligase
LALLAVPNVSEGRDADLILALESAFTSGAVLLDSHTDADHNRSVFTLAADPGSLRSAVVSGAGRALELIDITRHEGLHPCVGALDVCPVVWFEQADRDAALAEARAVAEAIGRLGIPVFGYGELASAPERAERAFFRRGGPSELRRRMERGELAPDWGPPTAHPSAGATLVTARPPLAAFNVFLDRGDELMVRRIAAELRESGGGLPGVRAIGLILSGGRPQISTNVHDPLSVPLAAVVARIEELAAPAGARPLEAELVGLIPEAALEGYPDDVPIRDFDSAKRVIEKVLPDSRRSGSR